MKRWIGDLRDRAAVARINARLRNVSLSNFEDVRATGGISELRVHHGLGYRLYFLSDGETVVLSGGDKDSQRRDTQPARRVATDWR